MIETKKCYMFMYVTCTSQALQIHTGVLLWSRAPSQYPKRGLSVRSRKVSKPRDRYFKLSYRFEIWQAHRQHCCRSACQISERSDNSKFKSRGLRKYVFSDIETGQLNGVAIAPNWPQLHQAASEIDTFNTIAYLINVQITKFYFSSMVRIDRLRLRHDLFNAK